MGEIITATANHPFYVTDSSEWIEAEQLTSDSNLLSIYGIVLPVDEIDTYSRQVKAYNITVDIDHTYFVGMNGVLNHNAKKSKCKKADNDAGTIRPSGSIPADDGLDVLAKKVSGQRGLNRGELGKRFHKLKSQGQPPGAAQSNSVNPSTGDVFDGTGEYIGNVLNDYL